jgi:hypothetical protein
MEHSANAWTTDYDAIALRNVFMLKRAIVRVWVCNHFFLLQKIISNSDHEMAKVLWPCCRLCTPHHIKWIHSIQRIGMCKDKTRGEDT